jgi:hypothetical protein
MLSILLWVLLVQFRRILVGYYEDDLLRWDLLVRVMTSN